MKIICTKEEFAAMLEVCGDRVKGDTCKECPLYSVCGGEKGIVKMCRIEAPKAEPCIAEPPKQRRPTRAEWMAEQRRKAEYGDR